MQSLILWIMEIKLFESVQEFDQDDHQAEEKPLPEANAVLKVHEENSQVTASSSVCVNSGSKLSDSSANDLHVLARKVLSPEDDKVTSSRRFNIAMDTVGDCVSKYPEELDACNDSNDYAKSSTPNDAFDPNSWSFSGSIFKNTMQNRVFEDIKLYFFTQVTGKLLVLEKGKEGSMVKNLLKTVRESDIMDIVTLCLRSKVQCGLVYFRKVIGI